MFSARWYCWQRHLVTRPANSAVLSVSAIVERKCKKGAFSPDRLTHRWTLKLWVGVFSQAPLEDRRGSLVFMDTDSETACFQSSSRWGLVDFQDFGEMHRQCRWDSDGGVQVLKSCVIWDLWHSLSLFVVMLSSCCSRAPSCVPPPNVTHRKAYLLRPHVVVHCAPAAPIFAFSDREGFDSRRKQRRRCRQRANLPNASAPSMAAGLVPHIGAQLPYSPTNTTSSTRWFIVEM